MTRVIGIVASPRKGRNTALLVQRTLEGAASQGAETQIYYLSDYDIGPCRGCDGCKITGICARKDDMQQFYAALERADGIVFGSPIYLDFLAAQAKLFLDRLYVYLGPNMERRFPKGKRAVIALTWDAANPNAYVAVGEWLTGRLSYYWDIETIATVLAPHCSQTPVAQNETLLRKAFEAGARLAGQTTA